MTRPLVIGPELVEVIRSAGVDALGGGIACGLREGHLQALVVIFGPCLRQRCWKDRSRVDVTRVSKQEVGIAAACLNVLRIVAVRALRDRAPGSRRRPRHAEILPATEMRA